MLKRICVSALLAISGVALVVTPAGASRTDRDKDGLPDRWEQRYHLSTHAPSAKGDPDHDGLTNKSEYRHHTNPRRKDTDRDGWTDGQEVRAGTNPRSWRSHPSRKRPVTGAPPVLTSPGPGLPTPPPRVVTCSTTVNTVPAIQAAARSSADGTVICVGGGSYPALTLDAARSGDVTISGAPGAQVTFADVGFAGSASHVHVQDVTSSADVQMAAGSHDLGLAYSDAPSVTLKPGVHDVAIQSDYLHGGDFGVLLSSSDCTVQDAPSWSGCEPDPPISNVLIDGNKLQGPFGEDALQIKNFRNVTVTRNEITEVREDGSHNDCLQTTFGGSGLVFRNNFEHDNRCQGLFVKDGVVSNVDVEDNYFVKNDRPCLNKTCDDGAPMTIWVTGITGFTFRNNVVWDNQGGFDFESGNTGVKLDHNVIESFYVADTGPYAGNASNLVEDFNVFGDARNWRSYIGPHSLVNPTPAFVDRGGFDYRLSGSVSKGGATYAAGVSWRPADLHFGP